LRQEKEEQQRVHNHNMTAIRRGGAEDLDAVAAIQQSSPGAAVWNVADYLAQDFFCVAVEQNCIVGFVVARSVASDEREILNLAVVPGFRRKGVARALLDSTLTAFHGDVFLEVRESNVVAQAFYKSLGFKVLNRRREYYDLPPETAIVMKFHSC
jgi:ribosomal-protein-alanine N-acetyltransferase